MTRIYAAIHVRKPVERVFDFVTTPGNWPKWHPSSLSVSGATDHSLKAGEQVAEEFLVAGRRGRVVWTVRESKSPRSWIIEGRSDGGGATITYTLTPEADGTAFERELVYHFSNPLLGLLDRLFFCPRIEAESKEALRRLKELIER